jgi:hypothetical protein
MVISSHLIPSCAVARSIPPLECKGNIICAGPSTTTQLSIRSPNHSTPPAGCPLNAPPSSPLSRNTPLSRIILPLALVAASVPVCILRSVRSIFSLRGWLGLVRLGKCGRMMVRRWTSPGMITQPASMFNRSRFGLNLWRGARREAIWWRGRGWRGRQGSDDEIVGLEVIQFPFNVYTIYPFSKTECRVYCSTGNSQAVT